MKGQLNHIALMIFGCGKQAFNQMLDQFFITRRWLLHKI
jgi:hypothetical protein